MSIAKTLAKLGGGLFCLAAITPAFATEPYPLEYWALRAVVSNVTVSPDGKYLALMKIPTRDANPVIEVFNASHLEKKPFILNADPMEVTNYDWVGKRDIVISFRQKVRDKIKGFNRGAYETKLALLDVKKQKIRQFKETNPGISNLLVNKPDKIILSFNPGSQSGSRIDRAFRPRTYYEFDLNKGTKELLMRGKLSLGQVRFNADGQPWTARGFDLSKGEFIWYIRRPGEPDWQEIYRLSEDSFDDFAVEGIDEARPDTIFVTSFQGRDKRALWEFNTRTKTFGEVAYARSDVDVVGVRHHSNRWAHPDTVTGVVYFTDKLHTEFFDPIEGATYAQLEGLIPVASNVRITSRSKDGKTLIVYNDGPHDPGSYYLLKDGRLRLVGSKQPLLKSADLADVRYISYTARDGMTIPAFITVPHGEGPFPTVVLPHGGPFVGETVGYDEWGQLLANNGYLVLQPEYRGSRNYGQAFYLAAFQNGGQGGHKMQDDLDDGATYLVKKGLADPDRLAMFGWSYGGYAALVAASRTPQLYQCVVAGAAVADTLKQVSYYSALLRGASKQEQLKMWGDSVSPINEVEKVNVPILLVHGSVDQRVPQEHVRRYIAKLDRYGKNYKYVELKGADHFYSTLFYRHKIKLYESLTEYLRDDCGPGGL